VTVVDEGESDAGIVETDYGAIRSIASWRVVDDAGAKATAVSDYPHRASQAEFIANQPAQVHREARGATPARFHQHRITDMVSEGVVDGIESPVTRSQSTNA